MKDICAKSESRKTHQWPGHLNTWICTNSVSDLRTKWLRQKNTNCIPWYLQHPASTLNLKGGWTKEKLFALLYYMIIAILRIQQLLGCTASAWPYCCILCPPDTLATGFLEHVMPPSTIRLLPSPAFPKSSFGAHLKSPGRGDLLSPKLP